jgi:uncharacterized lipoprotein YmbA
MRNLVLFLVLASSACFGGKAPHYNYYVLTPAIAPRPSSPRRANAPTLALGLVTIPRYLDRESIATRANDHRIVYSKQDRWAEPLDEAFTRILREDLAAALAPEGISVPARAGAPTFELQVEILRFEKRGRDRVELWARWTVRGEETAAQTREARIETALAGPTSTAAAAALSQAIARLAQEIAGEVLARAGVEHHDEGS